MHTDHATSTAALAAPAVALPRVLASDTIKTILMARLREMRHSKGMTQVQAARWFGVSQPRISHLAQNRVNRFTVDTLINMLAHAGVRVFLTYKHDLDEARTPPQPSRS
jgi:predicted XRE-type DNA-binding protein